MAAPVDGALPALNSAALSLRWGIPFAGLLLSIAVLPIVAPKFWHAHYGKIAAAWVLVLLIPLTSYFPSPAGSDTALYGVIPPIFTGEFAA